MYEVEMDGKNQFFQELSLAVVKFTEEVGTHSWHQVIFRKEQKKLIEWNKNEGFTTDFSALKVNLGKLTWKCKVGEKEILMYIEGEEFATKLMSNKPIENVDDLARYVQEKYNARF